VCGCLKNFPPHLSIISFSITSHLLYSYLNIIWYIYIP
jgi:hypothetical protein